MGEKIDVAHGIRMNYDKLTGQGQMKMTVRIGIISRLMIVYRIRMICPDGWDG